jgi:predicted negative regulator of RcsB-dependent stress response
MPKPIKRKISRQDTGAEETVRTFMSVAIEKIETNFRQVVIGAAIALAVIIAVAGVFFFRSGAEDKAERAFYEGYKAYYGLYDAQALPPVERYERSLESFKRSNEAKSSPRALLFMANSQNQLGRYDEALQSLSEIGRDFSGDDVYVPLAMYKSAIVLLKAGRSDEALSTLDRLYSGTSDMYRDMALVESARVLEAMGRKEESLNKYRAILSDFPESPFVDEARIKVGVEEKEEAGAEEAGQ